MQFSLRMAICAFILTACSSPCHRWNYQAIPACEPCYQASSLHLAPEDPLNQIGITIVHSMFDVRVYLDIYCLLIPPYEGQESLGSFQVIIDGQEKEWVVNRLEGGQRLWLTPEASNALISALLDECKVTIVIGRYRVEVALNDFIDGYTKLCCYPA